MRMLNISVRYQTIAVKLNRFYGGSPFFETRSIKEQ